MSVGQDENKVLGITRPAKVFKSKLLVEDGTGRAVGEIVQKNVFGKIRFDLLGSSGETLGPIMAENWRAWDFSIEDSIRQGGGAYRQEVRGGC